MARKFIASPASFLLGILLLGVYWFSIRPRTGGAGIPGFVEDMCYWDMSRTLMADQLRQFGSPRFVTDQFMTPSGASVPYMAWSLEGAWVGAYAWLRNRDFPFLWFWTLLSFLGTYLGAGFLLGRIGLSARARWLAAAAIVVFHVPRHFKAWHHAEHLFQHWFVWSLLLDAWIWSRFVRERRWALSLEAWRGFCLVGMLGIAGYYWGPLILEWALVRGAMLWIATADRRARAPGVAIEWDFRKWLLPLSLIALWLVPVLRWFTPLAEEARKLGNVEQGLWYFTSPFYFLRPLWYDAIFWWKGLLQGIPGGTPAMARGETIVSVGWLVLVPWLAALFLVRRRRGGPGFRLAAPFAILTAMAILYFGVYTFFYHTLLQAVVPFMSFFRVASRWGLLLPQLLAVTIVLAWPELQEGAKRLWARLPRSGRVTLGAIALMLALLELSWLGYPTRQMPPLSRSMQALLQGVAESPGTSVLNLPFCVAGGNGVCTEEQCPQYPESTAGECLRIWHGKKVYGLYQSRMTPAHCAIYRRTPYTEWFAAWRENRCFSPAEWDGFCGHLRERTELSAVLVYPDIWKAAGRPECLAEFERRLGPARGQSAFPIVPSPGGQDRTQTRLLWFGARCGGS
ncbi:MAG: hypothetical protein NDJ89_05445 [Oligoflexia bacterium]|nr:hypothetical protein [Oligoflexia bacterium]